jgi:hypothetical protein
MRGERNGKVDNLFEDTLVQPRFDLKAINGARRVVPITDEMKEEPSPRAAESFYKPRISSLISFSKPSWPLALAITLALVSIATGATALHRRLSSPSQYQAPVSVVAFTVIAGESDEDARPGRRMESDSRRPGERARNDYRSEYYSVLPPAKVELNKGRVEDRGKYERVEERGEAKRRDKEDKWRDKEKERGKGRRGKGGD